MFTRNWYVTVGNFLTGAASEVELTDFDGTKGIQGTINTNYGVPQLHKGNKSISGSSEMETILKTITNPGKGVTFGDSDVAPTMDDYTLAGNVFANFTGTASVKAEGSDGLAKITGLYTLTNTGDTAFTIREVALWQPITMGSAITSILIERTVLDSPVTIEPGGVGQVTYTIRMNYPTA